MGVPRFARWMTQKFKAMRLLGVEKAPRPIAALYIDMNGLIHPCCHGEDPSIAAASEEEKLRRICAALEELVEQTQPTTLLYLAIDGVAPRAKMNQQRVRRYSSAAQRFPAAAPEPPTADDPELAQVHAALVAQGLSADEDSFTLVSFEAAAHAHAGLPNPSDAFDSNCISPGTLFMERVAVTLRKFIEEKLAAPCGPWHPELAVVISDSNVPGEGEHKIVDFIRNHVCTGELRHAVGAHVIVGLDADLILLGMALHSVANIFILRDNDRDRTFTTAVEATDVHGSDRGDDGEDKGRESTEPSPPDCPDAPDCPPAVLHPATVTSTVVVPSKKKIEFFDLAAAADALASEVLALASTILSTSRLSAVAAVPQRLVDDFVVLCTFLGNDFMPRLPSGHCGDAAVDNFIEIYVRHVLPYGFIALPSGELDIRMLARWLRAYAPVEAVLFRQQWCKTTNSPHVAQSGPFPSPQDAATWMKVYRTTLGFDNEAVLRDACRHYVDGLRFVWRYYSTTSHQCPWLWFYPFNYAPLAFDLAEYTSVLEDVDPLPLQSDAPTPFIQLLCILPPTSCRLLPAALRPLMLDPPDHLKNSFPLSWQVDESASGGLEHLYTILLPFADLDALESAARFFIPLIAPEEAKRNVNIASQDIIVNRANTALSWLSPSSTDAPGSANFRWARNVPVREAGGNGVLYMSYADTEMHAVSAPKPRPYNVNVAQKFLPTPPRAALEPSKYTSFQRKFAPNASGITVGDSLLATCVFSIALVIVSHCPYVFVTEIVAIGALALLLLCLTGLCDFSSDVVGSGLQRNTIRDTMLDWLCPECTTLNFRRNETCINCSRPFEESRCPALFSSVFTRHPPNMDPDHKKYTSEVHIAIPDWLRGGGASADH